MLIRRWMTKDVVTVTPETSMLKAGKLMKDRGIRRLPVVDADNRVIGIVSDRDIKAASPSQATTLDVYELHYLLSEVKIRDVMTPNPVTIRDTDTVESVALLMQEKGFGGVPVVTEDGRLAGIITERDVFSVLVNITGVRQGGIQMAFTLENREGQLRPILDVLRKRGARIISLLSTNVADGSRHVIIRIHPLETSAAEDALIQEVQRNFRLLYWTRNKVHVAVQLQ